MQIKLNNIKGVFQALMLGLILFSASPSFAQNCTNNLDQNGKLIQNSEVCRDDAILNGFHVLMGELLNNNKAANSIYQKFIGDEPLSMPHSAEAISKVTLDIMRSMHMVAMTLCIAFLGYRILSVGLTMMNDNNKSLNDLWKWSDFAVVALAVLSLPTRDGVGFGVLGLVALVLFMMSQSIYVASFVYPLIFPSSTNLINGSETDVFANTSDEYATSLIKGISTAQDSAVYGAFLSVDTEGATLLTDNATSSSGFFGSVWNFFNRETRDPSFAEVYEGVFSDYS